jgi:hypothetical protein
MASLKERLVAVGLSQTDLSKITGHSKFAVNSWCSGLRSEPPWLDSWLYMFERMESLERARMMHAEAHRAYRREAA